MRLIPVLATLLSVFIFQVHAKPVMVTLPQGKLIGEQQGEIAMFKGVPYALAPVDERRWQPPRGLTESKRNIDASHFGAHCPQRTQAVTSEDCLFINVFANASLDKKAKQPVFVWIHGGGYVGGSGNMSDDTIAHWVNQGVVFVSFNYRLGALGILSHPNIPTPEGANFSVMDMVAALNWINANIQQFGGDPDRVTIAGGSAGGMAIQMLMVTPQSEGLFHRAIAQSGYGTWPFPRVNGVKPLKGSANAHDLAEQLVNRAAGSRSQKALPRAEIMQLSPQALVEAVSGFHLPIIDGKTLPEESGVLFMQGKQHAVPYISGGNSYDGSVYPYSGVKPERLVWLTGAQRSQVQAAYQLANPGFQSLSYQHLFGDMRYVLAGQVTTAAMQHSPAPGYRYFYALSQNGQPGAPHGSEVGSIFHPQSSEAAQMMQRYWRNFIETGNPNGEGLPMWQAVTENDENWLVIDKSVHQVAKVRENKLAPLKKAYLQRVKPVLND